MPTSTPAATVLALKEWGAVVHALLDGRQRVLLRKGGIHEKSFDVAVAEGNGRFVLFPTVAHSHAERVRAEHRDLLERGARDVADTGLVVRAGVELVDAVPVAAQQRLPDLRDLHIWTDESVQADRVQFRPRQPLQVLVVRVLPLVEPVRLDRRDEYGGCKSWIDLPLRWEPDAEEAVVSDEELAEVARRVRHTVT